MRAWAMAGAPPRQRVIFSSSLDPEHNADLILDGNQRSFWISTGLFPQSLIIELGEAMTPARVVIESTGIRRIRIEGCDSEAPVEFTVLAETDLGNADGRLQHSSVPCQQLVRPIRFLQIVMVSGWNDFCTCHTVQIALETSELHGGYVYKGPPETVVHRQKPNRIRLHQADLNYSSSSGGDGGTPVASGISLEEKSPCGLESGQVPLAPDERDMLAPAEPFHSEMDEELAPTEPFRTEKGQMPCDEDDPEKIRAYWLDEVQLNGMRFADAPEFIRSDQEITLAAVVQNRGALEFAAPRLQLELRAVLEASFGAL